MSPGFTRHQLKKLATALDRERVQSREQDGKTLSYVEGWFVIAEANRIFGFDGWDRQMVHFERLFERRSNEGWTCGYVARVAIRVRAGGIEVVREGTGFGQASSNRLADAHELALKAAETDATKRALATFGSRFGLLLYDKDEQARAVRTAGVAPSQASQTNPQSRQTQPRSADPKHATSPPVGMPIYRLIASDGTATDLQTPESFCSGLRQLLELARNRDEVRRLQQANQPVIDGLRSLPTLKNHRSEHYADILERLLAQKADSWALERFSDESQFVVNPPLKPSVQGEASPAAIEDAVDAARPVTDAVELPRFYGPFMPVPPYPRESLVKHLASAAKSPASDSANRANPDAPRISRHPPQMSPCDPPAVRTRRSQITGGFSIDKSALMVSSERRLRSKAHLQFVASKPCLVCEQLPCHAHHITFAQPRGLSQKVSDEFTVPLCVAHHNELHAFGNEASWWRSQAIEPLPFANALWRDSAKGDAST
jgi:DNA recombination protein Rad52